jgi:hypothetical protein
MTAMVSATRPRIRSTNARRYRYYVAHRAEHLQDARPVRIPAQDLETLVVQRLVHLLSDKLALLDALSASDDDAGVLQGLLAAASAAFQDAEDDLMQLTIEARVQRRGRSVRLVVTPLEASATALPENRALIELLAQGHRWLEQWLRGEVSSLRAIAKSVGQSERHVSRVMRAAFLAPDLVEAVIQGRQPTQLTLPQVMKQVPWDCSEQRSRFGLVPGINDNLSGGY